MATGPYALLGETIMGAASDYAARKDEDRRRALQLSDEDRRRQLALGDEARLHTQKLSDEDLATQRDIARSLISAGLLTPADINDPAKVQAAYEIYGQRQGLEQTRKTQQEVAAQKESNRISHENESIQVKMDEVQGKLQKVSDALASIPQPREATEDEIRSAARRTPEVMAEPDPVKRAELITTAEKKVRNDAYAQQMMDENLYRSRTQGLQAQAQSLQGQLSYLKENLTNNRLMAQRLPPPEIAEPSPVATSAAKNQASAALLGGSPAPAPGPTPPPPPPSPPGAGGPPQTASLGLDPDNPWAGQVAADKAKEVATNLNQQRLTLERNVAVAKSALQSAAQPDAPVIPALGSATGNWTPQLMPSSPAGNAAKWQAAKVNYDGAVKALADFAKSNSDQGMPAPTPDDPTAAASIPSLGDPNSWPQAPAPAIQAVPPPALGSSGAVNPSLGMPSWVPPQGAAQQSQAQQAALLGVGQ